jgi:hypothetical protein
MMIGVCHPNHLDVVILFPKPPSLKSTLVRYPVLFKIELR